jgi:hypothetical protein
MPAMMTRLREFLIEAFWPLYIASQRFLYHLKGWTFNKDYLPAHVVRRELGLKEEDERPHLAPP